MEARGENAERVVEEREGLLIALPPATDHEPVTDKVIQDLRDTLQR